MCNCKTPVSSTSVKQVVKKIKTVSKPKTTTPQRSVGRKISYRRPI